MAVAVAVVVVVVAVAVVVIVIVVVVVVVVVVQPPGLKSGDWHHERGHAHFSLNLLKHYLALTALDSVDRWRACFAARQGVSIIVWSAFGFDKGALIFKGAVRESSAGIFFSGPCVLPAELETTIGTERKEKRSVATNWH